MVGMKAPQELRNGDYLRTIFVGGGSTYHQIIKVDDIFYKDVHTSLAAEGTESFTNITNLDPPIDQLYYLYGVMIDGNVKILLKQPAATNRWGTNRSPQGGILNDRLSPLTSPKMFEMWCSENYPPAIQVENDINVAVIPILWWIGKRFSVRKVQGTPDDPVPTNYTIVQIGGVAE